MSSWAYRAEQRLKSLHKNFGLERSVTPFEKVEEAYLLYVELLEIVRQRQQSMEGCAEVFLQHHGDSITVEEALPTMSARPEEWACTNGQPNLHCPCLKGDGTEEKCLGDRTQFLGRRVSGCKYCHF